MKKFLVVLLALAMVFGLGSVAFAADTQIADYADLAGVPAEQQAAIYRLTALGVLAGDGVGGDFRPEDTITRAEFAKIAIFLAGKADAVDLYASFAPAYADVQDGTWYEGYVNAAVAFGYMKGYTDGTFKPGQTVTMQEVATVLLRIAGYTDALKGTWPNDYIRKANDTEIIAYVDFVGPRAATRAEVASLANETLDIKMVTEVENEVAAGLGYVNGKVDEDGFVYLTKKTNEGNVATEIKVLTYAFDATATTDTFALVHFVETSGWKFEDYKKGELIFDLGTDKEVASDYYIFGADLFNVGGHQVELTINEDNEVVFAEILSTRIAFDKAEKDGDKLKLDGVKYDEVDAAFDLANIPTGFYGYAWIGTDAKFDGSYVNKDIKGKVYDTLAVPALTFIVVEEVEVDDEDVEIVNEIGAEIEYDNEDETIVFIKDGEFVTVEDLEDDDVLFFLGAVSDDADCFVGVQCEEGIYPVWLAVSPVEGEVDRIYSESEGTIKLDDVKYIYKDHGYYSNDNGDKYAAAGFDTLKGDKLESVLYVPHYAWKEVATIIADVEDTTETFNAVVIGYEAGRKVIGTNASSLDVTDGNVTAIIVVDENGEERTLEFKKLATTMAEYAKGKGHSEGNADGVWANGQKIVNKAGAEQTDLVLGIMPELGDAVEITLNEKDQITDMYLLVPFSWNGWFAGYFSSEFVGANFAGEYEQAAEYSITAKGKVKLNGDLFSFASDAKIAAIYGDEDAVEAEKYDWANFEKVEFLNAEDLFGTKFTADYVAYFYTVDTEITHLYLVNPTNVGAEGDVQFGIVTEHAVRSNTEWFEIDGERVYVDEDAFDGDVFEQLDVDNVEVPFVAFYCLDGEYLTKYDTDDAVTKGELIPVIDENGFTTDITAAEFQTLVQKYYEDLGDDDYAKYTVKVGRINAEPERDDRIRFTATGASGFETLFFEGVEIVDMTTTDLDLYDDVDDLYDEMAETGHEAWELILVVFDGQEIVSGYLTK